MTSARRSIVCASLIAVSLAAAPVRVQPLAAAVAAHARRASTPIPKKDLQAIAAMLVAGEPLDRINRAWTALVLKHRDADFSRAINDIGRQVKAVTDRLVKDARARVVSVERTRKQMKAEITRARTASAQLKAGKQGLRIQQKRIERAAGTLKLAGTDIYLTTPEELETYLNEFEARLNSVSDDAQLANIDLQNALQRQQQNLQRVAEVSRMLSDVAMSIVRKIG